MTSDPHRAFDDLAEQVAASVLRRAGRVRFAAPALAANPAFRLFLMLRLRPRSMWTGRPVVESVLLREGLIDLVRTTSYPIPELVEGLHRAVMIQSSDLPGRRSRWAFLRGMPDVLAASVVFLAITDVRWMSAVPSHEPWRLFMVATWLYGLIGGFRILNWLSLGAVWRTNSSAMGLLNLLPRLARSLHVARRVHVNTEIGMRVLGPTIISLVFFGVVAVTVSKWIGFSLRAPVGDLVWDVAKALGAGLTAGAVTAAVDWGMRASIGASAHQGICDVLTAIRAARE